MIFLNIIKKKLKTNKFVLYTKNRNIVVLGNVNSKIIEKKKLIVKIGKIYYGGSDVESRWENKKDMKELECLKGEGWLSNFVIDTYLNGIED